MSGLLAAGWEPGEISLCVRRQDRADELSSETGCRTSIHPDRAAAGSDVVVVAVKPRSVPGVLESLKGSMEGSQTLVSIAAGVTTASYEAQLGPVAVVRAMPNTPALVRQGVTGIAAGAHGCVLEESSLSHLRVAVEKVVGGETFCSPEIVHSMFNRLAQTAQESYWRGRAKAVELTTEMLR